jgi:hypothetical protein
VLTFLVCFITSLLCALLLLVYEFGPLAVVGFGGMLFGFSIIPTLIGVVLYVLVEQWIHIQNIPKRWVMTTAILVLLFYGALWLWSILEVIFLSNLFTWQEVVNTFDKEFKRYLVIAFGHAIILPGLDIALTKRRARKMSASEESEENTM